MNRFGFLWACKLTRWHYKRKRNVLSRRASFVEALKFGYDLFCDMIRRKNRS